MSEAEIEAVARAICDAAQLLLAEYNADHSRVVSQEECDRVFAIAAITALDKLRGWQPIETAPKDGTSVLLFGGYSGREQFVAASINLNCDDDDIELFRWAISDGKNDPIDLRVQYTVTHWQPLPTPPGQP